MKEKKKDNLHLPQRPHYLMQFSHLLRKKKVHTTAKDEFWRGKKGKDNGRGRKKEERKGISIIFKLTCFRFVYDDDFIPQRRNCPRPPSKEREK